MKEHSINHMKLVLVDSSHNLFHWLVVVLLRAISALILLPLGLYLVAIGFSLSAETIQPYLPTSLTEKTNFYSAQLPYFESIRKFIFIRLNHWYQDASVWWTMVVGIPLMLSGVSIFLINLFNFLHPITNPLYNRAHCPFCKEPIKAIKKESGA